MLSLVMHVYPGISRDILGYPWPTMLRQDCCLILPPYPFSLEDPSDMSLDDAWNARPHCSSSAFCALATEGPPKMPPGRVASMTWKPVLCFSAPLRSSSCLPQGGCQGHGSCLHKAVRAVPHSDPVRCPLRSYAWTCASLSLFPERQFYSYHTSPVAAPQGQRVSVRNR